MSTYDAIVITGLGLVTNLGRTPEDNWAAIMAGKAGIGPMPDLEQRPTPDKGGGQAVDLPTDYEPERPRAARYLRFAIEQALRHAGVGASDGTRISAVFGTTLHGMRAGGEFLRTGNARRLGPFLAGSVLDDALSDLPIGAIRLTTCSACSSGLGSVGLATTLLEAGLADIVVAGGYDSVSEYSYAGFDSLRLIAAGLPRPFATDRDGMKVAEGYGVLVLERASGAAARGAPALAALAGFGETSDAFHLTQPRPDGTGAAEAIRAAMSSAGVGPEGVDMVAAHGTATPNNDAAEYAALADALGTSLPATPVVAFKSHVGHTLGGAGAVELVLSAMARRHGCVPPTANTTEADPGFKGLNVSLGRASERRVRTTLNLSLGFGGANACAVLSDPANPKRVQGRVEDDEPVITGVGIVLPGAVGTQEFAALLEGEIQALQAGPLSEDLYAHLLSARRTRRMSDYAKLTLAAAEAACCDASLRYGSEGLACSSALLGTTHGASPFCESYYGQIVREGLSAANPVLFAEGVPNAAAAHLSMTLGLRGACQTIIGTRAAGLHALMLAAWRIRQGLWTRAIVSAAEEFSPVVNSAYVACEPRLGSHGFVAGAGAVTLVVESLRAATARGARIWSGLGTARWSENRGVGAVADLVRTFDRPSRLWSALGQSATDRGAAGRLSVEFPGTVHRSVYGRLPELFSVGPLAAVVAGLLADQGPFAAVASEFTGGASGMLVARKT